MRTHSDNNKSDNKKVVFVPEGPFEAAAKEHVPGPYYAAVDEVMEDLEPTDEDVSGAYATKNSSGTDLSVARRDFMKLFGVGAAASAAACVRRPTEKVIPYVNQPIDQIPGVATHYATTCNECPAACGMVAKTREGRPVKLEGNPGHPVSQGALCGLGQAQLQGLYHPERRTSPLKRVGGKLTEKKWEEVLAEIGGQMAGKKVAILTGGATGSRHGFYRDFLKAAGSSETNLFTWEPNSLFASIAEAHKQYFGSAVIPRPDLRKADVIVGVGSDFLDIGISPVYHSKSFTQTHAYRGGKMGEFIQFESNLTLTGSRADERHVISPMGEEIALLLLIEALEQTGSSRATAAQKIVIEKTLQANADALKWGRGKLGLDAGVFASTAKKLIAKQGVVLAGGSTNFGTNMTQVQMLAILANTQLGAYDKVLHLKRGWMNSPVVAGDMDRFVKEASNIDVLIVIDSNPVFTVPSSWGIREAMRKIGMVVSIQPFPNETDTLGHYVLPGNHALENWGDEEPVSGFISVRQPIVRTTTDSRQAEDVLLWFLAHAGTHMSFQDYRSYLKEKWKILHKSINSSVDYDTFYTGLLRRGHIGKLTNKEIPEIDGGAIVKAALPAGGLILSAPLDHRIYDGRGAHQPILQEIGDGLTTVAWDSWVAINPNTCRKLGIKRNDVVEVRTNIGKVEAAVFPMPGLHADQIILPRGNGHEIGISQITEGVGVNPLAVIPQYSDRLSMEPATGGFPVEIRKTGKRYRLAAMQKHNDIDNRKEIITKVSLAVAQADSKSRKKKDLDDVPDLYPALYRKGASLKPMERIGVSIPVAEHRWGMAIDLGKCTGCGSCMVACSLENNVPQVGRDQINLGREMHWIRLDRYFSGPVDNPQVNFQPITCQQCNHAPCEAVCPVFATTHDAEGINAMTYNRCVGTRYCANACPYKVRRFNWWTHTWGEIGERPMDRNPRALNPDVTVRTRGVMEKCNFCVGRLRDAKHQAKEWNRKLRDGEVKTACQQTCPTDAITFGNLNDPSSRISRARRDPRAYLLLGGDPEHGHYGIKTLPNVSFLAEVVRDGKEAPVDHGAPAGGDHGHDHDHDHGHDHG